MGPIDPRLLRETPGAGRFFAALGVLAVLSAVAAIVWAELIARVVGGVFLDGKDAGGVSGLLLGFAAVAALRAALRWALETSGEAASVRARRRLRRRALESLVLARPNGLRDLSAGEIATTTTGGIDALDPYFSRFLPQFALAAGATPLILAWAFYRDLLSGAIMALTLPLIPVFAVLIGKAAEKRTQRRLRALSFLSAHFLDAVRGLATLRAYRRGQAQAEAVGRTSEAFRRETMGTLRIAFMSAFVLELVATMGIALIAVSIGVRLVHGQIELVPAFAVLVLAPEIYMPLRGLAAQFHASSDGLAAARRIFELIDTEPAISVAERPLEPPDLRSAPICFESVGFSYREREGAVLAGFDCRIEPGERVLLWGESGIGKSTLLSLLLRFDDPISGRITVGGVDLRELDPERWRGRISWLPQHPRLAPGTIAEALRLSAPGASDEELWDALERASAAELVRGLPEGLETVVGEGGRSLSAGELRRVALARALLRRAPLLLLDEPTAHLDATAAAAVAATVGRGLGGGLGFERTVIIASHEQVLRGVADRVIEVPELLEGTVA